MPPPETPQLSIKSKPEAEAVADLVRKHIAASLLAVARGGQDEATVLVLPDGLKAHSVKPLLDEYLETPERVRGTATLTDLNSFIAHVSRFKDEDSVVFADEGSGDQSRSPSLTCVYDYNSPTTELGAGNGNARWCQHRASYWFPLSPEWKAWVGQHGKVMSQTDFAAWVENRIADISDPTKPGPTALEFSAKLDARFATPAKLLEISRGLEARVDSTVKNVVRLESGEVQINYVTQHTDAQGAPLKLPTAFLIGVPVFKNGVPWEVAVRLRYRMNDGRLSWWFELHRQDRIFKAAFEEAVKHAGEATGLLVLLGAPEQ